MLRVPPESFNMGGFGLGFHPCLPASLGLQTNASMLASDVAEKSKEGEERNLHVTNTGTPKYEITSRTDAKKELTSRRDAKRELTMRRYSKRERGS